MLLREHEGCERYTIRMIVKLAYTTTCTQHDPKHNQDQKAYENNDEVYCNSTHLASISEKLGQTEEEEHTMIVYECSLARCASCLPLHQSRHQL